MMIDACSDLWQRNQITIDRRNDMLKKMLAASMASMFLAGAALAGDMGMKHQDPYKGVVPCPDSKSFEYVGGALFGVDKSNPSSLEMDALGRGYDRAMKEFNGANYIWVYVKGTTDSTGSEEYNDKLGMLRAEAVKQSLTEHGVKSDTVHMKSFGKRWPKYDNATDQGRQMNRAAHVSIVSMDKAKADWCYEYHPESVPKAAWWMLP
jgi:outer membrane protein OmpA-like peptidoglycan-associated protein